MKRLGKDIISPKGGAAIRLDNRVVKDLKIDEKSGTAIQSNEKDAFSSPTAYLSG